MCIIFYGMISDWKSRTVLLLGEERVNYLAGCHVLVVGLGGVGAYAAEQLCRAGIGKMTIVDSDNVQESNINRQLPALTSTVGKLKTEVVGSRLLDINPQLELMQLPVFLQDEMIEKVLLMSKYDFVVDAIDTITPKVTLLYYTLMKHIPLVSAMGTGAKLDPSKIRIADISKSTDCPLARVVRHRLYRLGITKGIPVVFSTEKSHAEAVMETEEAFKRTTVGTISYMPAIFGCMLASYVIQHI